jgi:ABC-type antimicrobial peptide transport system permease subunit
MNLALDVPSFAGSGVDAASSGLAYVGPDFVRTVGLTLVSGSDFESKDRSDPHRAIVNESFATHFFGTTDIIGRSFAFRGPGNTPIRISGVVKDARDGGVKRPTQRIMYLPFDQQRTVTFTVRAANSVPAVSEVVRRTLARLDPAVGVERMRTIDAQFDDVLRRERLLAALGSVFGGFALLLMAVGLYGMLNAMIVRRTTEIGIRLALGAARHQVVWMLVRETLLVVALGLTPGLGGHLAVGRLVQNQLFGVKASDPIAVGGAVAALFLVAAAAVLLPARRALAIAPSEALRQMET